MARVHLFVSSEKEKRKVRLCSLFACEFHFYDYFFRVKQTRFERSENRVCVTSLWKGTFGQIWPKAAQVKFARRRHDEVRAKREPSSALIARWRHSHRPPFPRFLAQLLHKIKIACLPAATNSPTRPSSIFFCQSTAQNQNSLFACCCKTPL